ncbi:MAG: UDP-N-acetylmuramate dehydrogenase [Elusimicrobia bacterium]|nr:UDP-N-acetylmuramate dehydrogenase [Elusimicrobiota bacterium]
MNGFPFPCLEGVSLAEHTTIRLGGPSRFFAECRTLEEIRRCLLWARTQGLRVQVLGRGSNILFADAGFDGVVLKAALKDLSFQETGAWAEVQAGAGENLDMLVRLCVEKGLSGIECLSGIPGAVGAVPIQNVGAYGQEAAETIRTVKVLDLRTLEEAEFAGKECRFGYRQSRFKSDDLGRYVVTQVAFRLRKGGRPEVRHAELAASLASSGAADLKAVREAVLALRRKKSMVVDPADPESVSVGSFFMNPVLPRESFEGLERRWRSMGGEASVPAFIVPEGVKVAAAWLVERAGFEKGYRRGGVGISANHALALVNRGGTTRELLALARDIQAKVLDKFGVRLELEPAVVE